MRRHIYSNAINDHYVYAVLCITLFGEY